MTAQIPAVRQADDAELDAMLRTADADMAKALLEWVPLESLPITWADGGVVHQMVPDFRVAVCGQIPPLLLTLCPPCGQPCPGCFDTPKEG
jgi:hypothetical protein